MKNPLFTLGYWWQRLVTCPLCHGRQAAHEEHVARERAQLLEEMKKKHGDRVREIPGTGLFVLPPEPPAEDTVPGVAGVRAGKYGPN